MPIIRIPHNFTPRPYQRKMYNCLSDGFKRGLFVHHRRAGKDKGFVNILARETMKRVGSYFYILPFYKQARAIVWEGMDADGFRFIDHIPRELIRRKDNQQMTLELANGSFVRFLGSDNIDSIVGTNPVGVLFSEFSLHKIDAWNYLRPILVENGGWALFNGTPRGKNHMYDMLKAAEKDPAWCTEVLTIEDTGVMSKEQVEYEIANGMPYNLAMQEFYCSFDAALVGAYYGEYVEAAMNAERVGFYPHDPTKKVHCAWDLGIDDEMVVLMFQQIGKEIRWIDTVHGSGMPVIKALKLMDAMPYNWGNDYLPHDIRVRDMMSGKSRLDTMRDLGRKNLVVVPKGTIEDGINAVRNLFGRFTFNVPETDKLVEAMKAYRAAWDPLKRTFGAPVHDWSSHFADAVRIAAVGLRDQKQLTLVTEAVGTSYDPLRVDDERYLARLEKTTRKLQTSALE